MQEIRLKGVNDEPGLNKNFLFAALGLMCLAIFVGLLYLLLDGSFSISFPDAYILPWTLLPLTAVLSAWSYLIYTKKFHLFNPIVFAGWTYFLPVFVGGGIILAAGWSQPYFLVFIQNPEYNIPLSLTYVAVGYLGLAAGYLIPYGKKLGDAISTRLPEWNWTPNELLAPALLLLVIGLLFNFSGFVGGVLGFQRLEQIGTFDALQYFLTLIVYESTFLLWLIILKSRKRDIRFNLALAGIVGLIPLRMILLGNRSTLFGAVITFAVAYGFSGRKLKLKHGIILTVLAAGAVALGIIYGTTFRTIKGTEEKVSLEQYIDSSIKTFDRLGTQDLSKTTNEAFYATAERIDGVSSLAVLVANYEKLAVYEASYGLENNIWNYTWTAFIPRLIWDDKPVVSDARAYGELYFQYDNSFAMTVIGDLLRNFGPFGIPIGMMILGFALRIIYASLIENTNPTMWKSMAYFMLLITVSYEAFYGTILPLLLRVGFVVFFSVLFIRLLAGSGRKLFER